MCVQRFGRAGRSGQPAIAILLAEPSVFQAKKKQQPAAVKDGICEGEEDHGDDDDENHDDDVPKEFKKKVEDGMRQWVEANSESKGCRRHTSNRYFHNNPGASKGQSF